MLTAQLEIRPLLKSCEFYGEVWGSSRIHVSCDLLLYGATGLA